MSVCVLVKVGEGLVLATDSASTVIGVPVLPNGNQGPQGVLKIFFTGKKLFQLGDLPVGIMSWGAGSFKERSIASLIEEFESTEEIKQINKKNVEIKKIADKLWDFLLRASDVFFPDVPKEGRPKTGIVIGGYTKQRFFPDEYSMNIPVTEPYKPRPEKDNEPNFGANWYGMTDAIVRFHHGRDDGVINILSKHGIDEDTIKKITEEISREIQYPVLFNAMPLQDAIHYAKFLIDLTIARYRFVLGAELCGGKVNLATITRKEGFREVNIE
jgi:hypothetical protein